MTVHIVDARVMQMVRDYSKILNRQEAGLRLGQAALLQGILYGRQCSAAMTARAAQEGAPQAPCYVRAVRLSPPPTASCTAVCGRIGDHPVQESVLE
jgi:hypothetical protein